MRLDKELVLRNFFDNRSKAVLAINAGIVFCDGTKILKPAFKVSDETKIEIIGQPLKFVSKGGLKLEKALQCFNINLADKVLLDVGSSTGGFVDCAIQNGVKKVYGVDVGKDQMVLELRENPKLVLYEKTDIRKIDNEKIILSEIVTIDVSFISVSKIIPKIATLSNVKEIICLIKPQFECGKEIASRFKGVVVLEEIHKEVIEKIINQFLENNFFCQSITHSPIRGGSGNIEYLAYFSKISSGNKIDVENVVKLAFLDLL